MCRWLILVFRATSWYPSVSYITPPHYKRFGYVKIKSLLFQVSLDTIDIDALADHDNILSLHWVLNENLIAVGNESRPEWRCYQIHQRCIEDNQRWTVSCKCWRQKCLIEYDQTEARLCWENIRSGEVRYVCCIELGHKLPVVRCVRRRITEVSQVGTRCDIGLRNHLISSRCQGVKNRCRISREQRRIHWGIALDHLNQIHRGVCQFIKGKLNIDLSSGRLCFTSLKVWGEN